MILETVEAPIYHERFGGEPHKGKVAAPYQVVWIGYVEPPISDQFQFQSFLGQNEQVTVWIDGRVVYAAGVSNSVDNKVSLIAGRRHSVRIEYINPDGRAELKLLWFSRVIDPTRLPKAALSTDS